MSATYPGFAWVGAAPGRLLGTSIRLVLLLKFGFLLHKVDLEHRREREADIA